MQIKKKGGEGMGIRDFLADEDGIGTVEMILILVEIYIYKRYVYPVFSIP